ncbi:unnamed protein product [Rotaria sp. Silwood1]|nr:unnamed protein product [Rotaria sp. Silwood1]
MTITDEGSSTSKTFFVQVMRIESKISRLLKRSIAPRQNSKGQYYQYYLRIDYTILQSTCKPIHMFNTSVTIESLRYLTNSKLNTITRNTTLDIDIISINSILKNHTIIKQNSSYKSTKTLCDYVLQLYIGLNFPSYCDDACQALATKRLTFYSRPFGDPVDYSFIFTLSSLNSTKPPANLTIRRALLFFPNAKSNPRFNLVRSTMYFNKQVYIRSLDDNRYISAIILDSSAYQTTITMSPINRSLFLITNPLDENSFENDSSTVYVSFLSLAAPNTYLRHKNRRINLGKNDQSIPFKQDATFKLLIGTRNKDMVAFQSINVPESYIATDTEIRMALFLQQPKEKQLNIDYFDNKFLFKLNFDV